MHSLERVRALIAGQSVDHLPVQPVIMMFAAQHIGIPFIDYTRDGRQMAAAQSKLVHDFGIDCLLTCSDPAREVIDIAGEGSINWYEDQGPAICEERAALLDKVAAEEPSAFLTRWAGAACTIGSRGLRSCTRSLAARSRSWDGWKARWRWVPSCAA